MVKDVEDADVSMVSMEAWPEWRETTKNTNDPVDYQWLTPAMEAIVNNRTDELGSKGRSGREARLLFVIVGAAPSMLSMGKMQSTAFSS